MSSTAQPLLERRTKLISDAQALAKRGVEENRDLTVEEQASFEGMLAEAGKLAERAQAIIEGEQRANELNNSFRQVTGHEKREDPANTVEGAFGKWAREARIGDVFDVNAVNGAEKRALQRVVGGVESRAGGESRAMSASGGVGPDGVYGQLWEYAIATSQILQAGADVINTTDGNPLPFPVVTSHAQTSDTTVNANAALPNSDATLSTVNLTVAKYAYLTLVPTELVQDTTFDLEGYISRAGGRELGRRIGKVASAAAVAGFTTVGATGPAGTATSLGNQATAGMGSDLLFQLYHSVLPDYRTNSAWLVSDPTFAVIHQLKSQTTGDTVFGSASGPVADTILNRTVYVDPNLPSPAASAKTIYFGEWAALKVRIAGGIRFERSNEYAFGNDQIAYRAIVRVGAVTVDPNAVKYFQHSAT